MPDSRFLLGVVGGATAVLVLGGIGTHLLSSTQSTTSLDTYDTVTVDGRKALAPNIVAGRTESLYHPLPWVGVKVHVSCPEGLKVHVSCPEGLKAQSGATLTCTGRRTDGTTLDIPVTVVRVTDTHLTWKFER
ncbi:DUF4333 domain-containing protein [Streptomyces sp. NPDC047461]|uniref:DUF4333 domain-containing protein n=1 Tax=Streptomyces sp. NPDC047461 TaxID=3155619 RepID=UPI0034015064